MSAQNANLASRLDGRWINTAEKKQAYPTRFNPTVVIRIRSLSLRLITDDANGGARVVSLLLRGEGRE